MKKYSIFSILNCIILVLSINGCEKPAEQTTTSKVATSPEDDCVTGVQLIDTNFSKSLRVFGAHNGTAPRAVYKIPDPCETVSTGY
ncbi:MAG TPA: hypothetical protein VN763_06100 [Saprospiraceae bacterium]|nr:hypothetical protein [Saprospiraceae bacterium]